MDSEAVIETAGLVVGYGGPPIVRGAAVTVRRGTMVTFVGPNGAGKSTLLRGLAGLSAAYAGSILYNGTQIAATSALERHAMGIVFVPQGRCNFGRMSVEENLEIAAHGIARAERRAARAYVFGLFPVLEERLQTMAGNLSGGEQQLLEMAMVLQTRPQCLLVDEPSLGLSPKMQADIFGKLGGLRDAGMTIIVVEQNVRAALAVSDDAAVLVNGEIVMQGPAPEVAGDPGIRRAYLGH
ncbi:amino acid/amide ABC transporter ATP-binding protein 2, HAAT family [Tistlia consotensis]|uniref:Amino acid/amide ABC transporter ATP-binding protein 2, HAAT family n=1 Tax=Tistlia consotensis USBA 355 TaxID=560819 RepID=A0A1Y6CCF4_9PROT|nr:ABC transporter ATP-binding protein [Tistlia consotensis]SMF47507.1 amino acid/amide ABC transporter ATP-binding protein 2, HAAT family [Tistlia consotensis USBA 355]SNR82390.1 amino acid/amide ABC transporter ATP-binding protein 2, HAAT family [Tistlia consotensis]